MSATPLDLLGIPLASTSGGIATAAPSATLADWSNLALYSAMVVYTVAMVLFAAYLAALGPAERTSSEASRELVGVVAGSAASSSPGTASSQRDSGEPVGPSLRARKLAGMALSTTWLATAILVGSVVFRGLSVSRVPWGNMFEFATAGACAAAVAYSVLARRNRWEWLGLFVVGPVLLTLGVALLAFYTEAAELLPALKSVWLLIHVVVAILAVGVFTLAFSIGIVYLVKLRREATPPARRTFVESLPSASTLERTAYGLNMIGFILWTFTLVAGAIWAQKAWGSYWTWDPKEVWTFVVWVVYAAYMHARATAGWEPRKAMWIALAGFGTILVNFLVVNIYFVGQHSYSGIG
ncbi:MAG: c-type cytochrome biogenesis protein CcsB [Dermatophilaceae bacterium]